MMEGMGIFARLSLPIAVVVGFAFAVPEIADASSERSAICKKKRKKKRKKRRVKRLEKKVTAKKIARWQRKRVPHVEIVKRASAAGYKVTKKEKRKLKKLRVKRKLIAKLVAAGNKAPGAEVAMVDAPPTKRAEDYNLDRAIDPNQIDFDAVPPPAGTPPEVAAKQKQQAEDGAAKAPAQKPAKKRRVVFVAKD